MRSRVGQQIPKALVSQEGYHATKAGEEREAIEALRNVLLRENDSVFSYPENISYVALPIGVVNKVRDFRRIAVEGSATRRDNASIAVLGYVNDRHPSLLPWMDAADYFMRITHISASRNEPPSKAQMIEKLSIVESALSVRLGTSSARNEICGRYYSRPTRSLMVAIGSHRKKRFVMLFRCWKR